MAEPRNVGIIGCGFIGRIYAQVLSELGIDVVAVADADPEARRGVAALLGCSAYPSLTELLAAEPAVQVVGVATPSQYHAELTKQALGAGCHVLCEKPLALNLRDVSSTVEFAERSERKLAVGFKMRFESLFVELHRLLDEGLIGRVQRVIISQHQPLPAQDWARSHGILAELLIHSIDMANWLLSAEPTRFSYRGGTGQANIGLLYPDSRDALITGAWIEGFPQIGGHNDLIVQVVGTKGHIVALRPDLITINAESAKQLIQLPLSTYADPFKREWAAFLAWIKDGSPGGIATGKEGLRVHQILDQIKAANGVERTQRRERHH